MGWAGMVRVDTNRTYQWLGASNNGNATSVRRSTITPTRSFFEIVAGPVLLNVTFLSPIEPSDLVKQSLPFIYIAVNVTSLDGNSHDVQLYSDISAEWISGDRNNIATWNMTTTAAASYHEIGRQVPDALQETSNIAEDSKAYYAMATRAGPTLQSGQDLIVRKQFVSEGALTNAQETNFRAIQSDWPVFGISVNLGNVTADVAGPVVWALGLVRDPVLNFTTGTAGSQQRNAYFWSQYSTIADAIIAFVDDYSNALVRAEALDEKIMGAAEQVSDDYVDLVSLGARQAMAVDVTIAKGSDGQWNMSDVKTFLKDIGNSGRVNPMEVIYAAFPIYLYLNPILAGTLLAPILEYQGSQAYTSNFSAADLGTKYPIASSDSAPSVTEGIQNSGYMLIMALAHAQATGDGSLAGTYYDTLSKWTDYLVQNSLDPGDLQVTSGVSETNLAVNGILGVKAMSVISEAAGRSDDASRYQGSATNLIQQWTTRVNASGHIPAAYDGSSSALIYNLYADKMLNLGLVDESVYAAQSQYYNSLDGAIFGLPLISSSSTARSDWTLLTAGSVPDSIVRNKLVTMVRSRAGLNLTIGAFPIAYDDGTGAVLGGLASPGQGAMFSLLALNITHQSFTVNAPSSDDNSNNNHHSGTSAGVIAGATTASVVGAALLAFLAFWLCRRQRRRAAEEEQNTRPTPLDTAAPVWPAATTGTFSSSKPNVQKSPKYSTTTGTGTGQRGWQSTEGLAGPSSPPLTSNQSSSGAHSEAQLLRGEVENLRRDIEQLRAEGTLPPQYRSERGTSQDLSGEVLPVPCE